MRRLGALLALAAVGVALGDDGGYSQGSRTWFAGVAFAALVAAVISDRRRAWRLARTPLLWVLLVLGVLGAVSTAWTVGIRSDAWHWGLTTAAYAALILATAVVVRDARDVRIAAGALCVMATGTLIVGLVVDVAARDLRPMMPPMGELAHDQRLHARAAQLRAPAAAGAQDRRDGEAGGGGAHRRRS